MDGVVELSALKSTLVSPCSSFARCFADILYELDVLDGGMIVLAMFTLNIFHPGFLLVDTPESRRRNEDANSDVTLLEMQQQGLSKPTVAV